jgi:HEAT repeat protein
LRAQLAGVPEIPAMNLATMSVQVALFKAAYDASGRSSEFVDLDSTVLLMTRPDLATLPVRSGRSCRLGPRAAFTLQELSQKLRIYLELGAPRDAEDRRPNPILLTEVLKAEEYKKYPEWLRPQAIPVLQQLLMHEDAPLRSMLVDLLADIPGPTASVVLAQRAVFDLAPEVREKALQALQGRPREDYREVLVKGLSYPWAPAADHSAEALVALEDRESVPVLVTLLKKPDPSAPTPREGRPPLVRELVRIQHSANCLMCHPPAMTTLDPVPGIVPGVLISNRLTLASAGTIANSTEEYSGSGTATQTPFLVRADVTYLRQDFSVRQPVESLSLGTPPRQRFDYLVRTRPAGPGELVRLTTDKGPPVSEQREAVLFALRELTGKDPGPSAEAWLKLFPNAELDSEAARLTAELVKAPAVRQEQMLTQYRDAKGIAYTNALARAIRQLKEPLRSKARDLLAERLSHQSVATVQGSMRDEDLEIRRAAASACALKEAYSLTPHLIDLLEDPEPPVAAAARTALQTISGQDFGPADGVSREERARAVTAWRGWWGKQGQELTQATSQP